MHWYKAAAVKDKRGTLSSLHVFFPLKCSILHLFLTVISVCADILCLPSSFSLFSFSLHFVQLSRGSEQQNPDYSMEWWDKHTHTHTHAKICYWCGNHLYLTVACTAGSSALFPHISRGSKASSSDGFCGSTVATAPVDVHPLRHLSLLYWNH